MIFAEAGLPVDIEHFIPDGPTALLVILLIGSVFAIVKGYVVPKIYYDKEVKRADDATDTLRKQTDAIEALTNEIRVRREARDA